MKWKQYTIETLETAEDDITWMLSELGITNVEVRDCAPFRDEEAIGIYAEVMPELREDDGTAEIVFYLTEEEAVPELLQAVREGLLEIASCTEIGSGELREDETEDRDWVNNWKEHFSWFTVDDILIKPTWVEAPERTDTAVTVEIDPGTAFGTGSHETTKLCIHGIEKYVKPGDRVLDVGTGSGILGIIALKKGASFAFGTDIDGMAADTARENIALNGIPAENFPVTVGDIISDGAVQDAAGYETYDLVVANILADIIIPLQREVTRHMKKGAVLVVSGIINLKEEAVREAILANPGLELLDTQYEGEWVSFAARKL